jgi:ACT domain-containing protein
VHLGLAAHIPLHGCLLATSESPHLPELVLSPFEFEKWDKIWRLNLTLKDRPGLFNEVTDVLEHNKALLLAAESSAIQQQSLYQLEVVMELVDESRIEWIRYCLLTRFFKEMTFMDKQPRLRIQRLQSLYHAKRDFEDQKQWPQHRLPEGFSPEKAEIQLEWAPRVDDGNIHIPQVNISADNPGEETKKKLPQGLHLMFPENVRHVLKNTVGRYEQGSRYSGGFYLRLSDTKNRFLRIVFFKSNDPSVHCRIEYSERQGALADITQVLKNQDFNILSAYLAPGGERKKSRLELVVRSLKMRGMQSAQRKEFVEQALSQGERISDLQIKIGYPKNYAHEWTSNPIIPARTGEPILQDAYTDWFTELDKEFLKQQAQIKAQKDPAFEPYWELAEQLNEEYKKITRTKDKEKSLFISCHYAIDQVKTIARHAKRYGFTVKTGENLLKDPTLTIGLIKKIRSCTHFLGVWSSDGAQKHEDKSTPSPWLLWEFGVAEAWGLTWRLLIQNDIDPTVWQKLAPHTPNQLFTTMNFVEKLKEILSALSELPPKENY